MKQIWISSLHFLDGLIDRISAILGALLLGQFPQFYGQYLQRLGGHLAEARYQLLQYTQAAESHHLTVQEYIRIHLESGNAVFTSTGRIIASLLERFNSLESSYQNFRMASPLLRLWIFVRYLDPKIAWETWSDYTPGIPITGEGLIYSLFGLFLAWGLYSLIKSILQFVFDKSPAKKERPTLSI